MRTLPFIKMHGLGNDFVIFDARTAPVDLTGGQVRAISDRRTGVGCDQLIVIEPPRSAGADAFMRIHNSSGGEVEACGNATRCVASMLIGEGAGTSAVIETVAGLLHSETSGDGLFTADMGPANLDWRDIPLAEAANTLHLNIEEGPFADPVAVNMGNPHAVFFVEDAETAPIHIHGPIIERHPLYPQFTNVEAAQVRADGSIRVRVWERGVGITQACGSGACAALVAAHRRGLAGRAADVVLDGGFLHIQWLDDGHVLMTGPVMRGFTGTLEVPTAS